MGDLPLKHDDFWLLWCYHEKTHDCSYQWITSQNDVSTFCQEKQIIWETGTWRNILLVTKKIYIMVSSAHEYIARDPLVLIRSTMAPYEKRSFRDNYIGELFHQSMIFIQWPIWLLECELLPVLLGCELSIPISLWWLAMIHRHLHKQIDKYNQTHLLYSGWSRLVTSM